MADHSRIVTFAALHPSFISTANPVNGSRRTAPSTRTCPPHVPIRIPEKPTNERENFKTAGLARGLNSRANPAMQKAVKTAMKIHGCRRTPDDWRWRPWRERVGFFEEGI